LLLKVYASLLAALGMAAIGVALLVTGELLNIFAIAYLVGFFAFQWVANFLITREGRR
jgi:hypothetical protein